MRLELDKKKRGLSSRILNIFYNNHEQFISTMLVGNNFSLVIYGILMAHVLEPLIMMVWANEAFVLLSQTIISTLLILVTAEFLPKTIFKINPNLSLNIFAIPLLIIYVLLYPVAKFSTFVSKQTLKIFGLKTVKDGHNGLLTKVDLDFFIQQSIDESQDSVHNDTEEIGRAHV